MNLTNIVHDTINKEISGLEDLKHSFDLIIFNNIVEKIIFTTGKVIITGVGKSGLIAKKVVSSLCSIGIASAFLHPGDAAHGDLGVITQNDIVIMFSNSGEAKELKNIISYCDTVKICTISISRDSNSYLAKHSDMSFILPATPEASDLDIPTTSSTMMLVLGDVLTITLKERIHLSHAKYAIYHPGGKIGLKTVKVKDLMIKKDSLPIVHYKAPVIDAMTIMALKKLDFALVIDDRELMLGIALATSLKSNADTAFDLITHEYKVVSGDAMVGETVVDLDKYKHLVILNDGKPEGVLTKEIFKSNIK